MAIRTSKVEGDEGDEGIVAEINITPLTDIFLVLLIIFMVTSSVLSSSGVDVALPQSKGAASDQADDGVIVTLLPNGGMRVNGRAVAQGDFGALEREIQGAFQQTASRLVVLEGDRQAFLGSAIQVMDTAKSAGAEKFAIATTAEGGG